MGEPGVRHVMKGLLADFDILMCVGGFKSVEEIDRGVLGEFEAFRYGRTGSRWLTFWGRIVSEGVCDDCGEVEALSRV